MHLSLRLSRTAAAALLAACAVGSHAQSGAGDYPSRTVRVIVPAASGSLTDPVARVLVDELARNTGGTWVVDNRPGAGGIIGADAVAKAPADGYTLLFTANNFIITPSLYAKVPFRIPDDFTSIGLVGRADNLLVASAATGIRNLGELVARAKASPKPLEYTSPLLGSAAHLTVELFKRSAGIALEHIPYKDSGQGTGDTLAGRIPVNIMGLSTALPHIRAGKLVPLAWTGARRPPELPETPTFVEAGYKDVHMGLWFGFVGPARLPASLVSHLNGRINAALAAPAVIERLGNLRIAPLPGDSQAMARLIAAELPVYAKLAADTGIRLD
ncbi:MAG: tripartite tricarboxylate transporter substrate binding protein [Burkholderiales bacterium]|nr:tripartite tricarboxylate transporter substrate binding protein [Burkholderiales bacterium]